MEINSNTEFFIVEKNDLNGQYMVHSKCNQLVQCFAFKSKSDANKAKDELNKKAFEDYQKHNIENTMTLTWKG